MIKYIPVLLAFLFLSCNNNTQAPAASHETASKKNYLENAAKKMTKKQLVSIAGEPTDMQDLGINIDERGDTSHTEIWYYGTNQSVTLINDSITGLDYNVQASNARIQHTIDSATAAERR